MKTTEKIAKLTAFIPKFKEMIGESQPEMRRKFEAMLVKKLKPTMEHPWDLSGARTFTQFLVELGYDKELKYFWDESTTIWGYYDTWFDEVWYCYDEHRYLIGIKPWKGIVASICANLGL